MTAKLHVNVDHVATLRQQRHVKYPDPVLAAGIAELAGAHGITVHLREDRRHILDRDVRVLRETVKTSLNLEMAMTKEMQSIALETHPEMVTLVPEKREELTTEGGLDVVLLETELEEFLKPFNEKQIKCSLFIDPNPEQIRASHRLLVETVELSTAAYCEAKNAEVQKRELQRLQDAASLAHSLNLEVAAGHGLDYNNVQPVANIPEIIELNIGHSIVCHSVFVGMERAVKEMLVLLGHKVL